MKILEFLLKTQNLLNFKLQNIEWVIQVSHQQVAGVYTKLWSAVSEERNGYEPGTLSKTPDQVKQLLQL